VSDQTIYLWRKRFVKVSPAEAKRLWQLEAENVELTKLTVQRDVEIEVIKSAEAIV